VERFIRGDEARASGQGRRCIFLRRTYYGLRCVLMSPEDWRRLRNNGSRLPCWEGGNSCPLKIRVLGVRTRGGV